MPRDPANQWSPGKLWSLWALLELNAQNFVSSLSHLQDLEPLSDINPVFVVGGGKTEGTAVFWLNLLKPQLEALGLRLTIKKLESMLSLLSRKDGSEIRERESEIVARLFKKSMDELKSRLHDEIEDRKVYCLSAEDADYLHEPEIAFGTEVADKFPDAVFDIEEASKLFAFERGTAIVFHLMRAMEVAVRVVGEKLNVTLLDRDDRYLEWGKLLANMKTPIEVMQNGAEKEKWSAAHNLLFHVKQAWRNPTMHPNQKYTMEEAKDIYGAVKAFMKHLASLV